MGARHGRVPRGEKTGRTRARLLLALLSVVVTLALVEVSLRVAGYTYPIHTAPDRTRGVSLRPGAAGWYRAEGGAYVRINSDGLRDREHTKEKPPNTLRIAVIGDSYAEAFQVPAEEAFWAVLERRLRECGAFGGREVEVINFGVSGYGTAQELITLRERAWDYSPDLVLLAVTTANDITDNSRAYRVRLAPFFLLRDGALVLDDTFREDASFRFHDSAPARLLRSASDYSRLVQLTYEARFALQAYRARRNAPPTAPGLAELGLSAAIFRPPQDPVWEEAWLITEKLLALTAREVRARGAKFLVVTLSRGIQVHPDPAVRREYMQKFGVEDLFYPDHRIKALGERESFPVLNLPPALQARAERERLFLHGFGHRLGQGHWNRDGHRLAGEMIANKIAGDWGGRADGLCVP